MGNFGDAINNKMKIAFDNKKETREDATLPEYPFAVVTKEKDMLVLTVVDSDKKDTIGLSYVNDWFRDEDWLKRVIKDGTYSIVDSILTIKTR